MNTLRTRKTDERFAQAPIGIFDSGLGGLTVADEIARFMPHESIIYVGDTERCPYGPRNLKEVESFVLEIGGWLQGRGVKLIVIACNTATAAGLAVAQKAFDVPIIGVIEPGARAAVRSTITRRVGVIGTEATIKSNVYTHALHSLDAGLKVFSVATPEFVKFAETSLTPSCSLPEDKDHSSPYSLPVNAEHLDIAHSYLDPLVAQKIDSLVLGCTHFPLLMPLIQQVVGDEIEVISSAYETALDVAETLETRGHLAQQSSDTKPRHEFFITGADVDQFRSIGSCIFREPLLEVNHLSLEQLRQSERDHWKG